MFEPPVVKGSANLCLEFAAHSEESDCGETLILDQLSDEESAESAVNFCHVVLKKRGTTDEIVGLSRFARRYPDTIDRANARVGRLRRRESRMMNTLRQQDAELTELRLDKEAYEEKYKEAKRKLRLEKAARADEVTELKVKLLRREEKLKHSEKIIETLRGQIGNAAAEFRSKFPGRHITTDRRRRASNSSCEALAGSVIDSSFLNASCSTTSSSSAAPTSDEASITAVAGTPPPTLENKNE